MAEKVAHFLLNIVLAKLYCTLQPKNWNSIILHYRFLKNNEDDDMPSNQCRLLANHRLIFCLTISSQLGPLGIPMMHPQLLSLSPSTLLQFLVFYSTFPNIMDFFRGISLPLICAKNDNVGLVVCASWKFWICLYNDIFLLCSWLSMAFSEIYNTKIQKHLSFSYPASSNFNFWMHIL